MIINSSVFAELSDVKAWTDGRPISAFDFVALAGKPSLLFAYASLLFPETICVDKRYFLGNGFSKKLYLSWINKGVNGKDLQMLLNAVRVSYLMQDDTENLDVLNLAANILLEAWKVTLPREVTVQILAGNTSELSVVFFQE